jgi:type I restriction enzyme S subunit
VREDEPPEGWAEQPLGELLEPGGLFDGPFGSNLKTSDYTTSGVRVIRLENLGNLRFNEDKRTFISRDKHQALKKHTVGQGDIIFGSFVDDATRVAMLPNLDTPAIAKADCFCIRPHAEIIDPRFLTFQLGTARTRAALIEDIHGATRPRITTRQLRVLPIFFPPLAEQSRIVTKVEELLGSVNAARERLARVSVILKRFRQAALSQALRSEREPAWPSKPLGEFVASIQAGNSFRCEERPPSRDEVGVVKVSAVSWGTYDEEESKTCVDPKRVDPDLFIEAGNFLFSRANTIELVGACVIAGKVRKRVMLSDKILRLRFRDIDPKWVLLCLRSPEGRTQIENLSTGTQQSMRNIGQNRIRDIEVPAPPSAQQRRIVRRVDALFAFADLIEKRMTSAAARADKLTQAILAKAFRGELL